MNEELKVSEPISDELRGLPEEDRYVRYIEGEPYGYVKVSFYEAMCAELRARWKREVAEILAS